MANASGRVTLWNVEVFAATAEEASISAAAKRLRTSAATVSQQLTSLETAIGATLLNRSARPVTLTPAGEMFLRRANVILNEAEQAKAELAAADLSNLVRLRLGMIEDFDADVTPIVLDGLAEDLTSCRFLLETGASHRLLDGLETRALDVVVAAEMGPAPAWMAVTPLLEEPFVAAVPKGALAKGADAAAALQTLPFVQYTTRHHMGRQIAALLQREGVQLGTRFELDSYHAILAMVAGGAGWSILTPLGWRRAARFTDAVDLVELPFGALSRRICLMARKGVMGDIPDRMAESLHPVLQSQIVDTATAEVPWLAGKIRVL